MTPGRVHREPDSLASEADGAALEAAGDLLNAAGLTDWKILVLVDTGTNAEDGATIAGKLAEQEIDLDDVTMMLIGASRVILETQGVTVNVVPIPRIGHG